MTPTGGEKFPALAVGFAEQAGKATLRSIFASGGGPVKSLQGNHLRDDSLKGFRGRIARTFLGV